jgi:hypothetical protein
LADGGTIVSTSLVKLAMVSTLSALAAAPVVPASAGECGRTVAEQLSGPTLNGMVPEGQAIADESQFLCGGSTVLTVQVKNVNLPDDTVLDVSLDFRPVGTITLSGKGGVLSADLGRFAVSNDEVRVSHDGKVVLIGAFFR